MPKIVRKFSTLTFRSGPLRWRSALQKLLRGNSPIRDSAIGVELGALVCPQTECPRCATHPDADIQKTCCLGLFAGGEGVRANGQRSFWTVGETELCHRYIKQHLRPDLVANSHLCGWQEGQWPPLPRGWLWQLGWLWGLLPNHWICLRLWITIVLDDLSGLQTGQHAPFLTALFDSHTFETVPPPSNPSPWCDSEVCMCWWDSGPQAQGNC